MKEVNKIESYAPINYVNNSEPDLDADNLNKAEQALKRVTDAANEAVAALKALDNEKLDTVKIVNNLLATDPTTVLSGAMGKTLSDKDENLQSQITQLNGDMGDLFVTAVYTGNGYGGDVEWFLRDRWADKVSMFPQYRPFLMPFALDMRGLILGYAYADNTAGALIAFYPDKIIISKSLNSSVTNIRLDPPV